MNEIKCEVVRDLMPLVIDEVSSDASKELVQAHMQTCEGCRGYYAGMSAAISRTAVPPESDKSFVRLGKRMKRNVGLQKLIKTSIILITLTILLIGMLGLYAWAHEWKNMPFDWADVRLASDYDGRVYAQINMKDGPGWLGSLRLDYRDGIYYITPRMRNVQPGRGAQSSLELIYDLTVRDGQLCMVMTEYEETVADGTGESYSVPKEVIRPVNYVRWGSYDGYTTLYESGEVLPTLDELIRAKSEGDSQNPINGDEHPHPMLTPEATEPQKATEPPTTTNTPEPRQSPQG